MHKIKRLALTLSAAICTCSLNAQVNDSSSLKYTKRIDPVRPPQQITFTYKSFIAPVAMVAYGLATFKSDPLQDFNEDIQKKIWKDNPHSPRHIDNYLQFAPAVAAYGLNIIGVHGKNNFRDRSIIYFMSNVFLTATVSSVKKLTNELRPDGSDHLSYPSGHTAEAFASAEFLRLEYKDVSGWYGVAGYAMAAATGVFRLYNNKHWMSDIIGGAGVGIASTKLAYWLYPVIRKKLFKKTESNALVMPYYQNKEAGLSMLYTFH